MKYLVWFALAFAFITHVVIPWHNVFQSTGVVLTTPDAYTMLRYADMFPNIPVHDWYVNYPYGSTPLHWTVFSAVIALFGRVFQSNLISAAVLPVLLFFLTLIPLYVIAQIIFNKQVATGSLVIYCLLPGELLERTKLGAADYHCWEIFLFTTIMMFVVLVISNHKRYLSLALAAIFMVTYWISWQGALLLPFVIMLTIGLFAFLRLKGWHWKGWVVLLYSAGLLIVRLALPATFSYAWSLFSVDLATTTNEQMPLFFTAGQFDTWVTVWNYFGAVFFFTLFGLGWFVYQVFKYKRSLDILFLVWSGILLWLTITMRRFDYYFAANAAILTSVVIYKYGKHWAVNKDRLVKYAVIIGLVVIAPLMSISIRAANDSSYTPSADWQRACQWFTSQSSAGYYTGVKPDYGVFTIWNYGYWLQAIGHQAVDGTGGRWPEQENRIFASDNLTQSLAELKQMNMKYIVIDRVMVEDNVDFIIQESKLQTNKYDTFMYKLYYQSDPQCKLVHWRRVHLLLLLR